MLCTDNLRSEVIIPLRFLSRWIPCCICRIITRSQIVPKHTDLRWVGMHEKLALLTNSTKQPHAPMLH